MRTGERRDAGGMRTSARYPSSMESRTDRRPSARRMRARRGGSGRRCASGRRNRGLVPIPPILLRSDPGGTGLRCRRTFSAPSAATSCTIRSCAGACPLAAPRSIARTCRDGSTRPTEGPAQTPGGSCAGHSCSPIGLCGASSRNGARRTECLTTRRRPRTWSSTWIRPWRWGRTSRGDGGSSRATTTTTITTRYRKNSFQSRRRIRA
mmetsp:Transcript_5380/g.24849  ORF Transcript_5380/g.24849 Transcript_5380/m.24849 type:complete len:208 (+) Transcript_5380:227-850(+)